MQGSEAAASPDAWTNDVVGNIGDAGVTGLEIDGWLRATDNVSIDYHLGYSNAEYEDAVYLSSVAGPNSSWGCNGSVCRADGRVDGNQVERTAKWQYGAGLNVGRSLANDWRFGARIDFNYRSKMYATPMNLAHNGDRMLANANASLGNGVLGFVLWGRNILDEEYVANSFVLPSFTRYNRGTRRTANDWADGELQHVGRRGRKPQRAHRGSAQGRPTIPCFVGRAGVEAKVAHQRVRRSSSSMSVTRVG